MIGNISVGDQILTTHIRFKNISDYEEYINPYIVAGYHAEDAIFNGYICKINFLEFNLVIRSQYGIGFDFKREII